MKSIALFLVGFSSLVAVITANRLNKKPYAQIRRETKAIDSAINNDVIEFDSINSKINSVLNDSARTN